MSYFWDTCKEYAPSVAIRLPDNAVITYEQLLQRADEITGNIAAGSLVALECENHPECIAAYLGCLRKGIVPILLDALLDAGLKKSLYQRYKPVAVWGRSSVTGEFDWHRWCDERLPELHPDLAILLSTSGTTGSPRLVRLSRRNLQANAESIVSYLGIRADDRAVTSLPMHYSYGLSVLNTHLLAGAALLVTSDSLMERNFWRFIKEAEATSIAGVPTMYEMLRRLRFERMELPSLRQMTQAGGRLCPENVIFFGNYARQKHLEFFVMYGQTEATARMAYLPHDRVLDKPSSIGWSIPGGELLLRDQHGKIITGEGEPGELVYRGNNVMMGYAEKPEQLLLGDEFNGELATGDLAIRDAEGFYTIVGRLKRFIKLHGNRISLDEVERRMQQDGVTAYATGFDELLIIALADSNISPSTLGAKIVREYKLHHSDVQVVSYDQIPLTSSGKVNYPVLLDNFKTYGRNI